MTILLTLVIDGEAIVTDDAGLAIFELIRRQHTSAAAVLYAFDLLELDGDDLRRLPIETRKRRLAKLLKGAPSNIALNQHFDGDGEIVFEQACKLGCEGIVYQAAWVSVPLGPLAALAEGQEPRRASRDAGSRRR